MTSLAAQQRVFNRLNAPIRTRDDLLRLFVNDLGFEHIEQPIPLREDTFGRGQALDLAQRCRPMRLAGHGEFQIFYAELDGDRLDYTRQRILATKLLETWPDALFVFARANTLGNPAGAEIHIVNVKGDTTASRRVFRRFRLGPGEQYRTAAEQLARLDLTDRPTISLLGLRERLDAAFDVEAVTKRFYQELANWFFWAREHVEFPMPKTETNRDAYISQSLIRLITRLIFCWFVKQMRLIPGELFDQRTLASLLKDGARLPTSEKTIFYKAILQNLFFATLNQDTGKRQFRKRNKDPHGRDQHHGITNLYRYEDLFADPKAFLRLVERIPFLNGGLFECLDQVYRAEENRPDIRIDGFSDHPKNPLSVPDFLFFGDERSVDLSKAYGEAKYKRATVRGLIHIFNRYNFTVTESTPLDQEVALDPELAGKVFENLLAAYNPETATTARKQTGSFYTPREIVDYMVDEALVAYLKTKLDESYPSETNEQRLRELLAYTDLPAEASSQPGEPHRFSPAEVETLIAAIDNLKALDPACGSGAFPMGLLHKLVFILGKLDPHNEQWKQKQIAKASEIPDATVREKTLADIEQAFAANELDYGRKLYLIENCIYGVDIQPIAVQIAKMRFFISLTVDQKADPNEPNLGIRPLPNLETKFVAANTLIGIERPAQQMLRNPQIDAKEAELRQVRERHFTARTPATKAKCRELDAKLRAEISALLRADGFPRETTEKLANWNPYDQNASADFFDPEWMFGIREGFDIVIGNPPYVSALVFTDLYGEPMRNALNASFESATGAYDIFVLFMERGIKLLSQFGVLSFITPNKYLAAKYAAGIRTFILANSTVLCLVDISGINVFESASVYPVITILSRSSGSPSHVRLLLPTKRIAASFDLANFREARMPYEMLRILPENIWGFVLSPNAVLLPKLIDLAEPLARLGEINATSTASESEEYGAFLSNKPQAGALKVVNTGTIDRYASLWGHTEMTHQGETFLTPYLPLCKAGVNERRVEMYKSPKVIFAKMAKTCEAFIDENGEFASLNTNCFYRPRNDVLLKYVGGFVNSRMFMFLYDLFFGALRMAGGYYQFQAPQLRVIPVKKPNTQQQSELAKLVDKILAAKRADPSADTSAWEREIDQLVYRLYGLTPEEIKIVEEGLK